MKNMSRKDLTKLIKKSYETLSICKPIMPHYPEPWEKYNTTVKELKEALKSESK